jgi:hypothetical protein
MQHIFSNLFASNIIKFQIVVEFSAKKNQRIIVININIEICFNQFV